MGHQLSGWELGGTLAISKTEGPCGRSRTGDRGKGATEKKGSETSSRTSTKEFGEGHREDLSFSFQSCQDITGFPSGHLASPKVLGYPTTPARDPSSPAPASSGHRPHCSVNESRE